MPITGLYPVVSAPALSPRPWATAETTYIPWPEAELYPGGPPRWLNGVTFTPFGCAGLTGVGTDICAPELFEIGDALPAAVVFLPFGIRDSVTCSTLGIAPEEMTAYMALRFAAMRSSHLGIQAWKGTYEPTSPSFQSEATVVAGAARLPSIALAEIEDELASKLHGALGMIHMTPGMLTLMNQGGGLSFFNNAWHSPSGHVVVADAGYDGSQPEGQGAPAADAEWIYSSGPVVFHYGPILDQGEGEEVIDFSENLVTKRYESFAILGFDPCTVSAVLVDRTP